MSRDALHGFRMSINDEWKVLTAPAFQADDGDQSGLPLQQLNAACLTVVPGSQWSSHRACRWCWWQARLLPSMQHFHHTMQLKSCALAKKCVHGRIYKLGLQECSPLLVTADLWHWPAGRLPFLAFLAAG